MTSKVQENSKLYLCNALKQNYVSSRFHCARKKRTLLNYIISIDQLIDLPAGS